MQVEIISDLNILIFLLKKLIKFKAEE